jgi:hypothetical protein
VLTQNEDAFRALDYGADDFDLPIEDEVTQKAGARIDLDLEACSRSRAASATRRVPPRRAAGRADRQLALRRHDGVSVRSNSTSPAVVDDPHRERAAPCRVSSSPTLNQCFACVHVVTAPDDGVRSRRAAPG